MNEQSATGIASETPAVRLRLYLGEGDAHAGQPLFTAIVEAARKGGLAGATVFKGIEGFGARAVVHAARVLDLSSDLPVVVEVVDEAAHVDAFFASVRPWLGDGMVTRERVTIVYRSAGAPRS